MKVWEKMRTDRQREKTGKQRQKELDQQREKEAKQIQKMIDDPARRDDGLNALRTWIDKWMDE